MARIWVSGSSGAPPPQGTRLADRTPPDSAMAVLARWLRSFKSMRAMKSMGPAKT